ncbi:MAG: hypothetical protein U0Z44_01000 [Kouleothrix sp.]|jgi:hypothetical protein|nr:hypothetical protein [Kouleothrix sp.]
MPSTKRGAARRPRHDLYPGQVNAAGVPLHGQTGEQAIKNFHLIISRLAPAERAAFDQLRAQAEAEQGQLRERAVGEPE